jgi:hypothetical protein
VESDTDLDRMWLKVSQLWKAEPNAQWEIVRVGPPGQELISLTVTPKEWAKSAAPSK